MGKYYDISEKFRNDVNEYCNFIILKYQNLNNRNHWNLTCSAMDWLSVSAEYLDRVNLDFDFGEKCSIEILSFVAAVDIMWEAIMQLNRVFMSMAIPFRGDKSIFNDARLNYDDNKFFKHIRGVFGPHAVNIDDDVKRFASWSSKSYINDDYDYLVHMYSADKMHDDVYFGFKIKDIYSFIDKRLSVLRDVIKAIENQEKIFKKTCAEEKIIKCNDNLKLIDTLLSENDIRLLDEALECRLKEVRVLLSVNLVYNYDKQIIKRFDKLLLSEVEAIYQILQTMTYNKTPMDDYMYSCPKGAQYAFSKLYSKVMENRNDVPLFNKELIDILKGYVTVSDEITNEELFYVFLAYIPVMMN